MKFVKSTMLLLIIAMSLLSVTLYASSDTSDFEQYEYGTYLLSSSEDPVLQFYLTNETLITEEAYIYANITLPNGTILQAFAGIDTDIINTSIVFSPAHSWNNESLTINLSSLIDASSVFYELQITILLVIYTGVDSEGSIYTINCVIVNMVNKFLIIILLLVGFITLLSIVVRFYTGKKEKEMPAVEIDCSLPKNKNNPKCQ